MLFSETIVAVENDTSRTPPRTDYTVVRGAIEYLSQNWRDQPSLEEIAGVVGLQPLSLQRLFTRWAGLSPKAFVQALMLDHARALLADSASVLDATYEVGLSGPGRIHDLFVAHEAMTPGRDTTFDPGKLKMYVHSPKQHQDRMNRPHPSRGAGAPTHGFRPRQFSQRVGQ